jgi:hypothetical protein
MKNNFTLIFSLLLAYSASAQQINQKLNGSLQGLLPQDLQSVTNQLQGNNNSGSRSQTIGEEIGERDDSYSGGTWNYADSSNQFTYDAYGRLLIDYYSIFITPNWRADTYDSLTYDANGNNIIHLVEDWANINQIYENNTLDSSSYDAQNRKLSIYYFVWSTNTWAPSTTTNSHKYTYDGNGNRLTDTSLTGSGNGWAYQSLNLSVYNGSNQKTTYYGLTFNGGAWDTSYRYDYTYDGSGDNNFVQEYTWSSGVWGPLGQDTITYNTGHQLLTALLTLWNSGTSSYNNESLITNNYDGSGNNTYSEFDLWNSSGGNWVFSTKTTKGYDANHNNVVEYDEFNRSTLDTLNVSYTRFFRYYQQETVQGIQQPTDNAMFSVYPNPAVNSLHLFSGQLMNGEISLYSITGQLLLNERVNNQALQTLDIGNLPNGVYLLQYKNDADIITRKVIKE